MKNFKIYLNAPITLGFVFISLIVLIVSYITHGASDIALFSTYRASITDPLLYVRLFTHIFGHIDMRHFMNNMLYILLLGPILEEKYHSKMIGIIMGVALTTGIIHNIFTDSILMGASGIVFAFIILASITGDKEGIPFTLILVTIFYLGSELYSAIFVKDNISQLTHIIGGITGALIGLMLKSPKFKSEKQDTTL